jgi:hypothetical protein
MNYPQYPAYGPVYNYPYNPPPPPPRKNQNKIVIGVLLGVCGLFGGIVTLVIAGKVIVAANKPPAPSLSADQRFVAAVHREGIQSSLGDEDVVAVGHKICARLPQTEATNLAVEISASSRLSYQEAQTLITDATTYLCPSQA